MKETVTLYLPRPPPPPPPPPPAAYGLQIAARKLKKPANRIKKSTMTRDWIIELKNEWNASTISKREREEMKRRRCIYRIPGFIQNAFWTRPRVVSLGPYHHGPPQYKPMEKLKRRMLGYYRAKIRKDVEEAMAAMKKEVEDLMDAYDGLEAPWNDKERFVQLMVVDGCFLLELHFLMYDTERDYDLRSCYDHLRPVLPTVSTDIILLENQVPIRALEIMAELGRDRVPATDVWRLLLKSEVPADKAIDKFIPESEVFVHKLLAVWVSRRIDNNFVFKLTSEREDNPLTVTELIEAGIEITKSDSMSISFEKGVLKLPHIKFVDDISWYCYNLMAFEKMHNLDAGYFSFLEFMDALVDSSKDTEHLRKRGVIGGGISSDSDIATFFNTITREAYVTERKRRTTSNDNDVAKSLRDYCRKWQNRWPASFRHLYLANPWKFMSLVGALLLLALTMLSTVYTILQYYNS